MHVFTDITLRGNKRKICLKGVLVDTGATFTVMSPTIIERVGATAFPKTIELTLGDGRKVQAVLHFLEAEVDGRRGLVRVASFENAIPTIGMDTIKTLGLSLKPHELDWVKSRTTYGIGNQIVKFNPLEKFLLRVTLGCLRIFAWAAQIVGLLLIVGLFVVLALLVVFLLWHLLAGV